MQIIENWSKVTGKIVSISKAVADTPGFDRLALEVQLIAPVKDFPSLISREPGTVIDIHLHSDLVITRGLKEGMTIRLEVRLAAHNKCFGRRDAVEVL